MMILTGKKSLAVASGTLVSATVVLLACFFMFPKTVIAPTGPPTINIISPQNITYSTSGIPIEFTINEPSNVTITVSFPEQNIVNVLKPKEVTMEFLNKTTNETQKITYWMNREMFDALSYSNNFYVVNGSYSMAVTATSPSGSSTETLYFSKMKAGETDVGISGCGDILASNTFRLVNDITDSTTHYCIVIYADNIVFDCQGHTIDGTEEAYSHGVTVISNNSVVKNCVLSDWFSGANGFQRQSNNKFISNTAKHNSNGIFLSFNGSKNTLENNDVDDNTDGIFVEYSDNNIIRGNTINANTDDGIDLFKSNGNVVTGNFIHSNSHSGLQIVSRRDDGATYGRDNTIYNNMFSNSNNYAFIDDIYPNFWSTTKTLGTNIVGGPYIGGNYWDKPDGTGYSDTCADADKDGICDTSYALATNNIDYLPLAPLVPELEKYDIKNLIHGETFLDTLEKVFYYAIGELHTYVYITAWVTHDEVVDKVETEFPNVKPPLWELEKIASAEYGRDIGFKAPFKFIFDVILAYVRGTPPDYIIDPAPPVMLKQFIITDKTGKEHYFVVEKKLPTCLDALKWWPREDILALSAYSPVDILITDPQGRRVGAIYENGVFVGVVNEIPNTVYTGPNVEPELIVVLQPLDGVYNVKIYGVETGTYDLNTTRVVNDTLVYIKDYTEIAINQGEVHEFTETPTPGAIPKLLKQDSVTELENTKTSDKRVDKEIDKIIKSVQKSLKDKLWVDDWHLKPEFSSIEVFKNERNAVHSMLEDTGRCGKKGAKWLPDEINETFENVVAKLVEADKLLARTVIEDARITDVVEPKFQKIVDFLIKMAEKEYDKALEELEKDCGKPKRWKGAYPEEKAIQGFSKSWLFSELAIKFAKKELKMRGWHSDYRSVGDFVEDIDNGGTRRIIFDILKRDDFGQE